ncbi:hypothetical protein PoB_006386600 [Plakobranchus ocellatus]|uniref:Uncharacterized protein n=1 Tax=Plakobranchus ocellatus TaxID=259542 RepID=A0AAV4CZJ0_9GAST|nr:hypothetical protein PoB_006386600 [Plakobranchus ocellatus]
MQTHQPSSTAWSVGLSRTRRGYVPCMLWSRFRVSSARAVWRRDHARFSTETRRAMIAAGRRNCGLGVNTLDALATINKIATYKYSGTLNSDPALRPASCALT